MIRDVTDRDFPREVEQASTPVLVEFWQPGCGHCLALLKQLEQLQEEVAPVVKTSSMMSTRLLSSTSRLAENAPATLWARCSDESVACCSVWRVRRSARGA